MSRETVSNNPEVPAVNEINESDFGTKKTNIARIRILDRPVHVLSMEEAVAAVSRLAQAGEKTSQVVTANVEILYASLHDQEMANILEEAELVTADGAGVLLAAQLNDTSLPERVPGFDLMMACLQEAACKGMSVFFLGARQEVLQAAIIRIRERFPGLSIAGSHHGYFDDSEGEAIAVQICARRPRILFVALGAPRQEKWIHRYQEKLPPCVAIGVGGSLDVLAGYARRAPCWMQRAGLEWLYRLWREPSRVGRMSVIPIFLLRVVRRRLFG